jgi:Flp pilus assembly protein TadG
MRMRLGNRRGHAMIELAFAAMIMAACLTGTFEFGYTFYVYNQLVSAVGNGGRYAATRTVRAEPEKAAQAIRNMVVYGDPQPAPDARPAVAGLTPDQVEVRWVKNGAGEPEAVGIAVREYQIDAVFKTFTFTGRPAVEFPFVGRYAPTEHEP